MCYSPIKIKNPTKTFRSDLDPLYLLVPCGKCGECKRRKRDDWLVRAYYEWLNCKENGGYTLFVTATYREECLPYMFIDGKLYECFCKKHYQVFMDKLRKELERHHNVPHGAVKVLWCSEYGGKTHRPHYHFNLFVTGNYIKPWKLRNIIRKLWGEHGFVYYGRNGGVVDSITGVQYVTKYITKDFDFHCIIDNYVIDELKKEDNETYKYLKRTCFPFHANSQNFGVAITKFVDPEQIKLGTVIIPKAKGGYRTVTLPMYYDRKFFMYRDEEEAYRLTPLGVDVMVARHNKMTDKVKADTESFMRNIRNYLDTSAVQDICCRVFGIHTADDIINRYDIFLKDYGIDKFFEYMERRFFLIYDDTTFPEITYPRTLPTYRQRKEKYLRPLFAQTGCLKDLDPDVFSNLHNCMFSVSDWEMETFCFFHEQVKFVIGQYKEAEFQRIEKDFAKMKQIKDIYNMY